MHPKLTLGLAVAAVLILGYAPVSYGAPSEDRQLRLIEEPHIIEGEYVGIEKVPFQASIEMLTLHTCGGAIVSPNFIVTAAHCVVSALSGPAWLKRVRVGSTTEIPIFNWGGKSYSIAEAKYHDKFDIRVIDYDVGVVRISGEFDFAKTVGPINLPPVGATEDTFVNFAENAVTSGWGLTRRNGLWASLWLKRVTIPLIPHAKCVELQADQQVKITPRMICGGANGKGGPCHGDSGGPLVHKNTLIGLVSWGIRCNDDKLPSVFTNVLDPEIRDYIKTETGQ